MLAEYLSIWLLILSTSTLAACTLNGEYNLDSADDEMSVNKIEMKSTIEVRLGETEVIPLIDRGNPIPQIHTSHGIGVDSLIAIASNRIHLFVDGQFQREIGNRGEGPCEHNRVSGIATVGDSLYITDVMGARLLGYHLDSGKCGRHLSNSKFVAVADLTASNERFVFMRTNLMAALEEDEELIYSLNADGELTPRGFKKKHVGTTFPPAPISREAAAYLDGDLLYYNVFPSNRMWMIDLEEENRSYFKINYRSDFQGGPKDVKTASDMETYFNSTELGNRLFYVEDNLLALSGFGKEPGSWVAYFFDLENNAWGRVDVPGPISFIDDEFIQTVKVAEAPDDDFVYEKHNIRYEINK